MPGDHEFTENEQGEVVPAFVQEFDWARLDSLEDEIRQGLKEGRSVVAMVRELVEMESSERVNQAVAAVICLIAESRRPKLMIDRIAYITGMTINQGASVTELGRKHRQRKQAFSQAALRLAKKLGLKPSRQMRSLKARESMARAYRERHGQPPNKPQASANDLPKP